VQQKIIWQIQRATITEASLSYVRLSLLKPVTSVMSVMEVGSASYLVGARQRAEKLPHVLYLKTPVVMMAARLRQQQRLPRHAARPRAWKLQAPRIIRAELAAKRNIVMPQRE